MRKKIIIACDSYKGCLASKEVNEAMALGVKCEKRSVNNEERKVENSLAASDTPEIIMFEMSDGGEGMLDAFLSAMQGERVTIHVHDALMRWIEADYGIVRIANKDASVSFAGIDDIAIIEIAQAVGLSFIEPEQRNPMKATSWGVGEMILHAYRHGIRRFIVGLGGSATSDCGIGMLKAMSDDWKRIRKDCTFVVASDVTNPLCGENGAAHVFAPQKGADAKMVEMLDARARKFAEVSAKHFGVDKSQSPCAGAAGGLGYAFLQYFNAEFRAGADLLLETIGFDGMLKDADLVITGEGHSDQQTLMGKLPQRILEHVLSYNVKPQVWLVSGGVSDEQALRAAGFDRVVAVTPPKMPLREALNPEVARRNIISVVASLLATI